MNRITDTIICALILIIMFLADYILKKKGKGKRNIEAARVAVATVGLLIVVIVVFFI